MSYRLPRGCCEGLSNMDFSKADIPMMYISWSDPNLWVALVMILFNPFYWNVIARLEYKTQFLSKVIRSQHVACCLLAASIFGLGIYRDFRFKQAMDSQPQWYYLHQNVALWSGYFFIVSGTVLVVTSFLALGFYGTFLGDYFGILMEKRVTGFPFNVMENPMYWGSTLNFVGTALVKGSQAGLFMSLVVAIVYKIALLLEGPFTTKIYAEHQKSGRKALNKQV